MNEDFRDRPLLHVIAAVIALAVVLLPVTGFTMRFAALVPLKLDGAVHLPTLLAGAVPVSDLALDGVVVVVAVVVLTAVYGPGFPWILLGLPFGFVGFLVTRGPVAEGRRMRFGEIWWIVASLLIVGAAIMGLAGVLGATPADYRFRSDVQAVAPDGRYAWL